MEVSKSENPMDLTILVVQDPAKVDILAMSWLPSDQICNYV